MSQAETESDWNPIVGIDTSRFELDTRNEKISKPNFNESPEHLRYFKFDHRENDR